MLQKRFPEICNALSGKLENFKSKHHYNLPLHIDCILEEHRWEQCTQWRIEIDFSDYEWSYETVKPHYWGVFIQLEEVAKLSLLYLTYNIYNSFSSKLERGKIEKLNKSQLDDPIFVKEKLLEIAEFVGKLEDMLATEIEEIDLGQLEYLSE